jgi:prepilin-type N-terminal cleavage/methylation domain-containing protein
MTLRTSLQLRDRVTKGSFHRATGSAFTLIELIVVIGIIAILASLLLPALAKAKTKARMVEEISAGKQLMIAAQMYTDDHKGAIFPGYVSDPTAVDDQGKTLSFPVNTRYPWRIVPYLSGSMKLIYSGENRAKLAELESGSREDYLYSVSLFPSLGINSYFIGGNQSEFEAADNNLMFGAGTVLTRVSEARRPSVLMNFISARSSVNGGNAQGYFQVTPPYLTTRRWATSFTPSLTPPQWGFVAPRFNNRAVAALLDGHTEIFGLSQMQDMRHWCNRAEPPDFTLSGTP